MVIRELVNRISFKISPADKKNAVGAMDDMGAKAESLITTFKGIGKGLLAGIVLATGVGTAKLLKFEATASQINFFARNQDEAEQLFEIFDKIANSTAQISRSAAQEGGAFFSQTTLDVDQVKQLSEMARDLALARPELGFVKIAEAMKSIVSGGDLKSFLALVPGFKTIEEIRSKTNWPEQFGKTFTGARGDILIKEILAQYPRILELIKKQEGTLTSSKSALTGKASDVFLKLGETTAPAIKAAFDAITLSLEKILQSKPFWDGVKTTAETLSNAFVKVAEVMDRIEKKGISGSISEEIKKGEQKSVGNMMFSGVGAFGTGQDPLLSKPVLDKNESLMKDLIHAIKDLLGVKYPGSEQRSIDVNVNVKGGSSTSINMAGYEYQGLLMAIVDAFKNISVKNGGGP